MLGRRGHAAIRRLKQRRVFTIATPAFSVTAAAGDALSINGNGEISYTDVNGSLLTAPNTALFIQSNGDDGLTPGSITVDTNGVLTGGIIGINARNYGSGALDVTANGNVTGTSAAGMRSTTPPARISR